MRLFSVSRINRGMNAALAMFDHFIYIGNRTDGSSTCGVGDPRGPGANCPHPHPGVLIVDVADPTNPSVVGEIGLPLEGNVGIKFYDVSDPVHLRFLSGYVPSSKAGLKVKPHEMFLWVDPNNKDRALLYLSTPTLSTNPTVPNLMIVDLRQVSAGGAVTEVAEGNWNNRYPGADNPANYAFNLFVHSMWVTPDGTRAYLAMEAGEFLVLDTSDIANNVPNPQLRLLTDP